MLTHPTLDDMAEAFIDLQAQDATVELSHAEWLGLLVDREVASRDTRRFQTRMRAAKLRHIGAAIEDVDFRTPRKLDRALFQQLATGRWIKDARNLMITGPCGVGKTWIACALGQKACRDNCTVIYQRLPRLFADLELAHGDGRFPRLFRSLVKVDLLDPTLADAILDRLVHNAYRFELDGHSMRRSTDPTEKVDEGCPA